MRRLTRILAGLTFLISGLLAQNQASAIFLLIAPGASASGTGEAGVAAADDAYASYWNPAALAYIPGREVVYQRAKWLPGLVNDINYNFLGLRYQIAGVGTFGAHLIYLDLGEQIQTTEEAIELGTFRSYMAAGTIGFGTQLSPLASVGFNAKIIQQKLADVGTGAEKGKGVSTDFAFDVAYYQKQFLVKSIDLGLIIANIGPKIAFIDERQADPAPTNMKVGIKWHIIDSEHNRLSLLYDVNKLLVASWLGVDLDADGIIGGYDADGLQDGAGDFNSDGKIEAPHTDPWYLALITSWLDDSRYGGDVDVNGNGFIEADEEGNSTNYTFANEIRSLVHNVGLEYWYSEYFAIRVGYIDDKVGKLFHTTFGAGIHYGDYGFDFGYIYGEQGQPLTNTMRFSLNIAF